MSLTRRAFVSVGIATVLTGFNSSSANAQVITTARTLLPAVIKFSEWAWPHLRDAFIGEALSQAAHYTIEHREEIVQVVIDVSQKGLEKIEAALKAATDSHLLQITSAAIAAGIVLTVVVTGPANIVVVPIEIVAEAATLPFLLIFFHDDVSNFVAGKAYQISYISD